jgi:hypothetical protein
VTIPSLTEFTDYLNYYASHRPESTQAPAHWHEKVPTKKEVVSFVNNFWLEWGNINAHLKPQLPYAKWLSQQPNYRSAAETAFRLRKKRRTRLVLDKEATESRASADAELLIDRFRTDKSFFSDTRFDTAVSPLLDRLWSSSITWSDLNARALLEYFYTDHAKQTLELRPALVTKYEQAQKAVEEFMATLTAVQCSDPQLSKALGGDIFSYSASDNRAKSAHRSLFNRSPIPRWMDNPIKRRGERIREQLLVYRYWQMNKRWGGFPAAVVRDLMYIDSIDHQYNERTIERMFADFTGTKRQKSQR